MRSAHFSHELQIVGRREYMDCVRHKQNIVASRKRCPEHIAHTNTDASTLRPRRQSLPCAGASPRQLKQQGVCHCCFVFVSFTKLRLNQPASNPCVTSLTLRSDGCN